MTDENVNEEVAEEATEGEGDTVEEGSEETTEEAQPSLFLHFSGSYI